MLSSPPAPAPRLCTDASGNNEVAPRLVRWLRSLEEPLTTRALKHQYQILQAQVLAYQFEAARFHGCEEELARFFERPPPISMSDRERQNAMDLIDRTFSYEMAFCKLHECLIARHILRPHSSALGAIAGMLACYHRDRLSSKVHKQSDKDVYPFPGYLRLRLTAFLKLGRAWASDATPINRPTSSYTEEQFWQQALTLWRAEHAKLVSSFPTSLATTFYSLDEEDDQRREKPSSSSAPVLSGSPNGASDEDRANEPLVPVECWTGLRTWRTPSGAAAGLLRCSLELSAALLFQEPHDDDPLHRTHAQPDMIRHSMIFGHAHLGPMAGNEFFTEKLPTLMSLLVPGAEENHFEALLKRMEGFEIVVQESLVVEPATNASDDARDEETPFVYEFAHDAWLFARLVLRVFSNLSCVVVDMLCSTGREAPLARPHIASCLDKMQEKGSTSVMRSLFSDLDFPTAATLRAMQADDDGERISLLMTPARQRIRIAVERVETYVCRYDEQFKTFYDGCLYDERIFAKDLLQRRHGSVRALTEWIALDDWRAEARLPPGHGLGGLEASAAAASDPTQLAVFRGQDCPYCLDPVDVDSLPPESLHLWNCGHSAHFSCALDGLRDLQNSDSRCAVCRQRMAAVHVRVGVVTTPIYARFPEDGDTWNFPIVGGGSVEDCRAE